LWERLPAFVADPAGVAGAALAEAAAISAESAPDVIGLPIDRGSQPSPKAVAAMRCRSH